MPDFVLKIEENQDVFKKILELMDKDKISEIVFIKAAGKLRDPEVVTHGKQGSVSTNHMKGDYEVNAISGSISRKKGLTYHQVNVAVTQTGTNAKIGHLKSAKAGKDFELTLKKIDLSKMIM